MSIIIFLAFVYNANNRAQSNNIWLLISCLLFVGLFFRSSPKWKEPSFDHEPNKDAILNNQSNNSYNVPSFSMLHTKEQKKHMDNYRISAKRDMTCYSYRITRHPRTPYTAIPSAPLSA